MATSEVKELYHYTDLEHLRAILQDGYLKPSPSDLVKPRNLRVETDAAGRKRVVSDTDDYKPVVWALDYLDFDRALQSTGLDRADKANVRTVDKSEAVVIVSADGFELYTSWAKKNGMDKKWFREFTAGTDYKHFYVNESPVSIKDATIAFRPDVRDRLLQDMTPAERVRLKHGSQ